MITERATGGGRTILQVELAATGPGGDRVSRECRADHLGWGPAGSSDLYSLRWELCGSGVLLVSVKKIGREEKRRSVRAGLPTRAGT